MKALADSHAIIWFVADPDRLSNDARTALLEAERTDGISVSVATLFDLWYTVQKSGPSKVKRSDFDAVRQLIDDTSTNVEVLPLDASTTQHVGFAERDDLPDPFDRMIVSTAIQHEMPLITRDKRITDLGVVRTIW